MASYTAKKSKSNTDDAKLTAVGKEYKDKLKPIQKKISAAHSYYKDNCDRYHEFLRFTFKTATTQATAAALEELGKPNIEFNMVNAPLSRLCGEFSKQQPSIYVTAEDGAQVDEAQLEVVEGHIRHILWDAQKHNTQYNAYRFQLGGGFDMFKVFTEYANDMSFDQVIRFTRAYEPTFVGFDPSAREVTKSDAEWYYELYPMTQERFEAEYPKVDISTLKFDSPTSDFTWSYGIAGEKIIMVADFYEKKRTTKKIIRLSNKQVMTPEEYEDLKKNWDDSKQMEQMPIPTGEERSTIICNFCRYRLVGSEIFDYKETDFKDPNYVYIDGDSVILKESNAATFKQFTKPYLYHAKGIQELINLCGRAIADDVDGMVMHKFMACEEGLPDQPEFQDAYKNVQKAQLMVYKALLEDESGNGNHIMLPPPAPVPRVPLPESTIETFNTGIQMLQSILGSTDMQLGVQNNQLSGLAIVEAATQSNSTAMPYVVNYMQALNQVAQIIAYLIPKYYVTARTIPIIDKEGNRETADINQDGGVTLDYGDNAIKVRVEAGVNFAIAKNRALQQLIALMQASPLFAQFMNEEGLPILLDNIEFVGVDIVKDKAEKFMQKIQQQQQQPSPEQMKAQNDQQANQLKAQQMQLDAQNQQAELQLENKKLMIQAVSDEKDREIKRVQALADIQAADDSVEVALINAQAEEKRAQADMGMMVSQNMRETQDQEHNHLMDILTLARDTKIAQDKTVTDRMKKTEPKPTKPKPGAK